MSVTFQVDLDYTTVEKVKLYMDEAYPGIPDYQFEGDPYVSKEEDTGRYYEMVDKIDFKHEVNMCNRNFAHILRLIDVNMAIVSERDGYVGSIKAADLFSFQRKLMLALNRSDDILSGYEIKKEESYNFMSMGLDVGYIKSKLTDMLEVVKNAKLRNRDVFWS